MHCVCCLTWACLRHTKASTGTHPCLQESDIAAECERKQADSEAQRAKAAARAAAAAKMVREQKLQPCQQVRSSA